MICLIKNLKNLRKSKGISQQQIADYFSVSLDYLVGRTEIKEMVTKPKMSDLSEKEAKFVQKFRCLKENQKDFVFQLIDSYKSDKE